MIFFLKYVWDKEWTENAMCENFRNEWVNVWGNYFTREKNEIQQQQKKKKGLGWNIKLCFL